MSKRLGSGEKGLEKVDDLDDLARIPIGVYEHYKGKRYYVLGIGRDHNCEARGPVVVYTRLYSRDGLPMSIRSASDFLSDVSCDGRIKPRFTYLGLSEPSQLDSRE